jgi:plasmid maintenance system antidote protein VapI
MNTSQAVDDRGTEQSEAVTILRNLRDRAFDSSDEKLAVALGRPTEEIESLIGGEEVIDDDLVMKARGIAQERGVAV